MSMFIHFFCLYPLGLSVKLYFNMSKEAYCKCFLLISGWRADHVDCVPMSLDRGN